MALTAEENFKYQSACCIEDMLEVLLCRILTFLEHGPTIADMFGTGQA